MTDRPPADQVSAVPDRSTLRLALVVGGLVLAVLLGFGLGRINGGAPAVAGAESALSDHRHPAGTGAHEHGADQGVAAEAQGLSVTGAGYTLVPTDVEFTAGRSGELRFQVRDAQRGPVTRFAVVHDEPMHLIVVRRDLTGYQHLHPDMAADGTWSVPLTLPQPGVWRAYADFTALADDGRQTALTLGVDLVVPGGYAPRSLPAPATSTTVDGITVERRGTPAVGVSVPLTFRFTGADGGTPTLERHLGAYGHLVALRAGDLGYLHVHPEPELVDGVPTFWVTVPGTGRYRLFLDFKVGGTVRTAEFTLDVP
ncbi:hypothetical protein [Micromonospora endolithica]|uniref:Secreted protein n=1 Tax=Micromonospora endolithica TaxID=230091 RepID=A0A3A9Z7C8_9ACTN|nr:hypothetical protein [Micromonospora endolithica]RKN44265.1 hypothetical protein D7223_18500 [Micromonospora endolithica]TWJ25734.1 hypothetical protein JD76_05907 [Micromonospora endolithica]